MVHITGNRWVDHATQYGVLFPACAVAAKLPHISQFLPTPWTIAKNFLNDKTIAKWTAQDPEKAATFTWNLLAESNRETILVALGIGIVTATLFQAARSTRYLDKNQAAAMAGSLVVTVGSAAALPFTKTSVVAEVALNVLVVGTGLSLAAKGVDYIRPALQFLDLTNGVSFSSGSRPDTASKGAQKTTKGSRDSAAPANAPEFESDGEDGAVVADRREAKRHGKADADARGSESSRRSDYRSTSRRDRDSRERDAYDRRRDHSPFDEYCSSARRDRDYDRGGSDRRRDHSPDEYRTSRRDRDYDRGGSDRRRDHSPDEYRTSRRDRDYDRGGSDRRRDHSPVDERRSGSLDRDYDRRRDYSPVDERRSGSLDRDYDRRRDYSPVDERRSSDRLREDSPPPRRDELMGEAKPAPSPTRRVHGDHSELRQRRKGGGSDEAVTTADAGFTPKRERRDEADLESRPPASPSAYAAAPSAHAARSDRRSPSPQRRERSPSPSAADRDRSPSPPPPSAATVDSKGDGSGNGKSKGDGSYE